jgi:hypothetical protein
LLAVALAMVAMAVPSAAAQNPPTQFCYQVEGGIAVQPTCWPTLAQCEYARSNEPAQFGVTTTSCSPQAKIEHQKPS